MRTFFLLLLVVAVLAALLLPGCGSKNEVLIGFAGPMTGDQAKMGIDQFQGIQIAVQEWAQKGGVLGRPIRVITGDDRADPKEAVSVANMLINSKVTAVIGHYSSSCTIPASQLYNESGVIQITASSTNPQFTEQGFKRAFRACGRDDQQGSIAAQYVLRNLMKTKIAILHDKTTYGQGLAEEFKKEWEKAYPVLSFESITRGDKDFTAILTKLKGVKAEVLFYGGYYPEASLLLKQAKEVGLNVIFVSGDGTFDQELVKIGGPASEGAYCTYGPATEDLPSAQAFYSKYKAAYGEPGPFSIYAYDAVNMLFTAMTRTGTTDPTKIAELLHNMVYDGAKGQVSFDARGDLHIAPYIMWQVQHGKWVPLGPPKRVTP